MMALFHGLIPRMPPDGCCPWFMGVGYCLVLFFSSISIAVSDSAPAAAEAASLTAANILILTLFWSLRSFVHSTPPPTAVKFAVWLFSTSTMAILTWCLTSEASSQVISTVSWVLAAITSLGTFHFMFFSSEKVEPNHHRSCARCIIRPLNACFGFSLVFVLFNSVLVIYGSSHESVNRIDSVVFEFTSYLSSILLLWCIAVMGISAIREWAKIGVWAFATMLAMMVVSKAAEAFPLPVKYLAWAMVVASSLSSFHAFFLQFHGCVDVVHDSIVVEEVHHDLIV